MSSERSTSDWYRVFGEVEARGQSTVYEEWAQGVAADAELIALIDELPLQKRQPNLVFATARLLGAPERGYREFRDWLVDHWPAVVTEALHRMTQTNEPRRCAALLPVLAALQQDPAGDEPLALLEIGASAGLCLYPDRYSYRYGEGEWRHPASGPSTVRLQTDATGPVPIPVALPDIVWRAGIDLEPLLVGDPEAMRWLETLVWPEQHERRERIRSAAEIVRADPPLLLRGNAIDELAALAQRAPKNATTVVITSGVLVYLPYLERMRLVEAIRELGVPWVSLEGVGVLPDVDARLEDPKVGRFVLALDSDPLAYVGPHGQSVDWFDPAG